MGDLGPNLPITTLNLNGLNKLMKRKDVVGVILSNMIQLFATYRKLTSYIKHS